MKKYKIEPSKPFFILGTFCMIVVLMEKIVGIDTSFMMHLLIFSAVCAFGFGQIYEIKE